MGIVITARAQEFDIQQLHKAKKFDWSGSLGANTTFYNTTGTEEHSSPFNWNLNGNINIRIMEVLDLPFSFTVGKYQQGKFTKPFLQFGITPTYKWAKLHLGHRNLTFNPYTLSGHTFLGVGIELNPKKFRFAAMYGRLRPAVEIDTSNNTVVVPSFKRKGYGVKIGYGNDTNFIDLMYFRGEDDINSIQTWKDPKIKEKQGDANALIPVGNKVLGVSAKTTLWKKFTMVVDGGLSFYNPNIADPEENENIDKVNFSKRLDWAGKTTLGYAFENHNLRLDYEKILPGYITLGSYLFNTDLQNITFSPSGNFFKGKLIYALSAGMQQNNLDAKKTETTKRFIANGNMSINPAPEWGVDMSYNNFVTYQRPGTIPLNDATYISQVNQTITVAPRFTVIKDTSSTHTFSFTGSLNDVNDRNVITKLYGNMKAMIAAFNHVSSFNKRGNSLNTGLNYNIITQTGIVNTQLGVTLGYSQSFFNNVLSTNANVNLNKSLIDKIADGSVLNGTLTMGCAFAQRHSLNFSFNIISTKSKQFENYVETIGTIGYALRLK